LAKQIYRHPNFVTNTDDFRIENKRYWLVLTIDDSKTDNIIVILKNPSMATKDVSDKTISNVTHYIERNSSLYKCLNNVGKITIANLIPLYETYSNKLKDVKSNIYDEENFKIINELTSKNKKVIIAWGDHPSGLYNEYQKLKELVFDILDKNKNDIYFVDKMSKTKNPKHAQTWGYTNELKDYSLYVLKGK
jgi:hypothetical protein